MRRSSSTTSRCGASSGRTAAGCAMLASARGARAVGPRNEAEYRVAAFCVDHGGKERPRGLLRAGTKMGKGAGDTLGLQAGQFHRELFAFWRDEKEAVPAVVGTLLLQHI